MHSAGWGGGGYPGCIPGKGGGSPSGGPEGAFGSLGVWARGVTTSNCSRTPLVCHLSQHAQPHWLFVRPQSGAFVSCHSLAWPVT